MEAWTDYHIKIHEQVSDLAVRAGFSVVDLLPALSACPLRSLVFPVVGDDHPSVIGHEVAARAIAKELLADSSYFLDLKPQQRLVHRRDVAGL